MILTLGFGLSVHLCRKPNIEYKFNVPYFQWYVSMTFLVNFGWDIKQMAHWLMHYLSSKEHELSFDFQRHLMYVSFDNESYILFLWNDMQLYRIITYLHKPMCYPLEAMFPNPQ